MKLTRILGFDDLRIVKTDDFNSARADGERDLPVSGKAGNSYFPAIPALSENSGGTSLHFRQKWPGLPDPGQLGWPGSPGSGVRQPGSRGPSRVREAWIQGPQGLLGGPGRASQDPPGPPSQGHPGGPGPGSYPTVTPDRPWSIRMTGLDRPRIREQEP